MWNPPRTRSELFAVSFFLQGYTHYLILWTTWTGGDFAKYVTRVTLTGSEINVIDTGFALVECRSRSACFCCALWGFSIIEKPGAVDHSSVCREKLCLTYVLFWSLFFVVEQPWSVSHPTGWKVQLWNLCVSKYDIELWNKIFNCYIKGKSVN